MTRCSNCRAAVVADENAAATFEEFRVSQPLFSFLSRKKWEPCGDDSGCVSAIVDGCQTCCRQTRIANAKRFLNHSSGAFIEDAMGELVEAFGLRVVRDFGATV